jgi:hypothetical protein
MAVSLSQEDPDTEFRPKRGVKEELRWEDSNPQKVTHRAPITPKRLARSRDHRRPCATSGCAIFWLTNGCNCARNSLRAELWFNGAVPSIDKVGHGPGTNLLSTSSLFWGELESGSTFRRSLSRQRQNRKVLVKSNIAQW